ncbi:MULTISPECIES: hypothetical protein [unclassified Streptomyces]|nr:hypothetical protein [Streptomyces sp. NBC_00223]
MDQHSNWVARALESGRWNRSETRRYLNRGQLLQYLYSIGDYLDRAGYLW